MTVNVTIAGFNKENAKKPFTAVEAQQYIMKAVESATAERVRKGGEQRQDHINLAPEEVAVELIHFLLLGNKDAVKKITIGKELVFKNSTWDPTGKLAIAQTSNIIIQVTRKRCSVHAFNA